MRLLDNKSVVVTGGASGIGRSAALIFAREGANVSICDIKAPGAQETLDLIHDAGGTGCVIECDVSRADSVETMVSAVVSKYGRLDGVFNNAGIEALDHAAQNIRINAIAPGVIDTPLMERRIKEMPEIEAPLKAAHPMGRLGTTQEVVETAAWLLSDRASFFHSSVMSVDGGYLAI